jgi:hypothetical protein
VTALALTLPILATTLAARRLMRPVGWVQFVECAAIGAGLGIGLSSIPFFLWRLLELPVRTYPIVDGALWGVVAVLAYDRRRPADMAARSTTRVATWALPLVVTALILFLSALVVNARLAHVPHGEWDAWAYWQVRASFLAAPEGWRNTFRPFTGSDYPLMLPAAVARVWTIAGYSAAAPAVISVLFTMSTAALLIASLWKSAPLLAATGAGLLLVPEFLYHGTGQCADVPLGFFLLTSAVVLFPGTTVRRACIAGAAIGLAAWTKNEGLVVAATVPAVLAAVMWRREAPAMARRLIAGLLMGLAPATIVLVLYHVVIDPPSDLPALVADAGPLGKLLDVSRHRTIWRFIASHTAQWGLWALFSPVWFVAAWTVAGAIRRDTSTSLSILAARTAALAILTGTYVVYVLTPHDLAWHMQTSWTRIVAQVWPVAVWTSLAWVEPIRARARPGL